MGAHSATISTMPWTCLSGLSDEPAAHGNQVTCDIISGRQMMSPVTHLRLILE
jgi:hypothetical protein